MLLAVVSGPEDGIVVLADLSGALERSLICYRLFAADGENFRSDFVGIDAVDIRLLEI